jgi:hypothetical protein
MSEMLKIPDAVLDAGASDLLSRFEDHASSGRAVLAQAFLVATARYQVEQFARLGVRLVSDRTDIIDMDIIDMDIALESIFGGLEVLHDEY